MRSTSAFVAGCVSLAAVIADARTRVRAPVVDLVVEPASRADEATRQASAPAGGTLVLNALDEAERRALAKALHDLADGVAGRANPLFVPLDATAERDRLTPLLRSLAPRFTAAAVLSAGRWRSGEGDLVVAASAGCARGQTCVPVDASDPRSDLERRARFVAWPLGYAIVLDASSAASARRAAEALRRPPAVDGPALVLTASELHGPRRSAALEQIFVQAKRVEAHLGQDASISGPLRAVLAAQASPDELPWLRLPRGGVLVVPRLGGLAGCRQLVADVRARLGARRIKATWLASPP